MLQINQNTFQISAIAEEWSERLYLFLTEKSEACHEAYKDKMFVKIKQNKLLSVEEKRIAMDYITRYCDNVEFFAKANEAEMEDIQQICGSLKSNSPNVYNELKEIFIQLYKDFVAITNKPKNLAIPISYYFIDRLGLRTCPYCNRAYTFNIYNAEGKRVRPEYDHFYDKATYPFLALSFYNLVPSCPICNHIKGIKKLHVNPFFHDFKGVFRVFETEEQAKLKKHEKPEPLTAIQLFRHAGKGNICLDTISTNEREDMRTLGLDEFYKKHEDYVEEIVEKAQAYSGPMLVALSSTFQGAGYSPQQVFEFVWGKDIALAQNNNRPLSKLTHDILEQVGIIEPSLPDYGNADYTM